MSSLGAADENIFYEWNSLWGRRHLERGEALQAADQDGRRDRPSYPGAAEAVAAAKERLKSVFPTDKLVSEAASRTRTAAPAAGLEAQRKPRARRG